MLESLDVKNFTAFPDARLCFAGGLNVIVGENGLGKTHLLKLPYAVMAVSAEEGRRSNGRQPTKALLRTRIAEKLVCMFRPVRAWMALAMAGAMGGKPGSPTPAGGSPDGTMCTSIGGTSGILGTM